MEHSRAHVTRRLAAVLQLDMVGYSRLMSEDEAGTLACLKALLDEIIRPEISAREGRVVKLMGDGALVEFPSAVQAVACAISLQHRLVGYRPAPKPDCEIAFRVGVNVGDVVVEDDDIYGEGVNIAARLETLAEPGTVCVSEAVRSAVGNRLPLQFADLGEQRVKNIPEPVRAYRVQLRPGAQLPERIPSHGAADASDRSSRARRPALVVALSLIAGSAALLAWYSPWRNPEVTESVEQQVSAAAEVRAIAVLPFANTSGDPDQEYFSDGISEDIITDLSQISSLAVIARNSSFGYRGSDRSVQDIGRELGAGYVMSGSVRKAGDRVRVNVELADVASGRSVWAERYDRLLVDIFDVQDEIRGQIVAALSVELAGEEEERLVRRQTDSFKAYDLFLRGRRLYNEYTLPSMQEAERLYREAIELDPEFARAHGALGVTLARQLQVNGEVGDRDLRLDLAKAAVDTALRIEPTSPQVQWASGYVHMMRGEFDLAAAAVERAVALSPNFADGYGLLALINNQLGRGDQALRFIRKGMRLNPGYSWDYPYNEGRALYDLGEYDKAVTALLLALERNENAWNPRLYLAACYVRLGRLDDAEWEVVQLQTILAGITLGHLDRVMPMADGEHRTRFFEDLGKAGLPQ